MKKSYYLAIIVFAINLSGFSQSNLWGISDDYIFEYNTIDSSTAIRYTFPTNGSKGSNPYDGLMIASNEMIYYTMNSGGNYGYGTVNMFNPQTYTNTVIHHFDNNIEGTFPRTTLIEANGKLYGNTYGGGSNYDGHIFEINLSNNSYMALIDLTARAETRLTYDSNDTSLYYVGLDRTIYEYDLIDNVITTHATLPFFFRANYYNGDPDGSCSGGYMIFDHTYDLHMSSLLYIGSGNFIGYYSFQEEYSRDCLGSSAPSTSETSGNDIGYLFNSNTGNISAFDSTTYSTFNWSNARRYSSGKPIINQNSELLMLKHGISDLTSFVNQNFNNGRDSYIYERDTSSLTISNILNPFGNGLPYGDIVQIADGRYYGFLENGEIYSYNPNGPIWGNNYRIYPSISGVSHLIEVQTPPVVVGQPQNITVCEGISDSVKVSAIGGQSFLWYQNGIALTNETDSILIFSAPTTTDNGYYYCEVTNANGTTASDSSLLIVNPLPNVLVNATPNVLCEGDSVLLVGSGATSYVWNNSVVNGIPFLPTSDQTYVVTGTDNNGCVNADSLEMPINNIDVFFVDDSVYCGGTLNSAQTGTGTSFTYNWTPNTDLSCTNCPNPIASPNVITNYHLEVIDNNGCVDTDSIVLNILAPPIDLCVVTVDSSSTRNVLVWEKPSSQAIDYFKVYRDVVGTYTHIIDIPYDSLSEFVDTSAGINPNATQYRYRISAVDTCGIESPQSDFHQTIHLNSPSFNGSSVDLVWQAYDGFDYNFFYRILRDSLSNSDWEIIDSVSNTTLVYTDLAPPINYISTTRYLIEIAFAGVCSATKASNYSSSRSNRPTATGGGTPGAPVANFISNLQNIPLGVSVDFADQSTNSPTSWSWTFTGGSPFTSTLQNPTGIVYNVAGNYDVTLVASNANGSDTETKSGYIVVGASGIEDFGIHQSVRIYPNPTKGEFTLELENNRNEDIVISIYNAIGQNVLNETYALNGSLKQKFDVSKFGDGIYNIEIKINEQSTSYRLVVN